MDEPRTFDPKSFLANLVSAPGVYQMFNAAGEVLYVGKAKNLKKRVSSYFNQSGLEAKTLSLVGQIASIQITVTGTETEALILEANLIKQVQPKYNILLRDDKSYPYIFLSDHEFPRLGIHRGAQKNAGRYFGPYPSAASARESLNLLQKLFPVRQCEDTYYRHRSRACLQHQIGRCSAPCVKLVAAATYAKDVEHVVLFLEGRSDEIVQHLGQQMDLAAGEQHYEQAARIRDQIQALRKVQETQIVSRHQADLDVLACALQARAAVVHQLVFRGGRLLGSQSFQPRVTLEAQSADVLGAFVSQYYVGDSDRHDVPKLILLSESLPDQRLMTQVFTQQRQSKVQLEVPQRGDRLRWVQMAQQNADIALRALLANRQGMQERLTDLVSELELDEWPKRMECFDVSHTQGERAVASCVVFDLGGAVKSAYRRFNIQHHVDGDDYASLRQALMRRYSGSQADFKTLPDVIFVDGGKGQLNVAYEVLQELQLTHIKLVGVAKGRARRPGTEQLFFIHQSQPMLLPSHSLALSLIQEIRDEAHRFAIMGHRARRQKARTRSELELIEGVGPKRRQQLLRHFGGLSGIKRAGMDDLCRVPGISRDLAQRIYDTYHV